MGKSLSVDLKEFVALLKRISLTRKRASSESATLTFRKGFAELQIGAMTLVFHATGNWGGEARFPSTMMVALKKVPPSGDPVTITFDKGQIAIGSFKMSADWSRAMPNRVVIPDDAEWTDLLLAARELKDGSAWTPKLRQRILNAQGELAKRIGRAAVELAPLGITQSDLRALIEVRFLEKRENEKE
jgi:hypothetical protein